MPAACKPSSVNSVDTFPNGEGLDAAGDSTVAPTSMRKFFANPVGGMATGTQAFLRSFSSSAEHRRFRDAKPKNIPATTRFLGFPWGKLSPQATDEGLMKAKHCTMLCRLSACPHPSTSLTPSPPGKAKTRRATDGRPYRCVRRFMHFRLPCAMHFRLPCAMHFWLPCARGAGVEHA